MQNLWTMPRDRITQIYPTCQRRNKA